MKVDWRSSLSLVGTVVKWLAVPLCIPLAVAVTTGQNTAAFVITTLTVLLVGFGMEWFHTDPELGIREGFLMVSTTWFVAAAIGAVPYIVAGSGVLADPVNAFFESMSGFTTTGSTVMESFSFDVHSPAILLWRQISQWLGGMGIVVLAVAILPRLALGGTQLMQAEAPGPGVEKLTPRIVETARRLWILYVIFTVLLALLLYGFYLLGLASNMHLFNAVSHALTTLPTGGFSPEARSIGAFSPVAQWTIIPFMFVAGTNFALLWRAFTGRPDLLAVDREFRVYGGILAGFTLLLGFVLFVSKQYPTVEECLRHGLFQVLSIVTTTGYATTDFNLWGGMGQTILFLAMFIGGCAGSTGGGIKVVRWMVGVRSIGREMFTTVHPRAVRPVRIGERVLQERTVRQILMMILVYIILFLFGTSVIELMEVNSGLDLGTLEMTSTVAACLGNIGPGFGSVGPMNNFGSYSDASKIVLAVLMWMGRLEIFTVLILFLPAYWKG